MSLNLLKHINAAISQLFEDTLQIDHNNAYGINHSQRSYLEVA